MSLAVVLDSWSDNKKVDTYKGDYFFEVDANKVLLIMRGVDIGEHEMVSAYCDWGKVVPLED